MKHRIAFLIILTLFTSACSPQTTQSETGSGDVSGSGPQAWIDTPLSGTTHPLAPLDVLAHASDPGGIAEFELSANGQVVGTSPAGDSNLTLANVSINWNPTQPGRYTLQVRAKSNNGAWSPYADTIVLIGEQEQPEERQVQEQEAATGSIGGAVFADQDGNGIQDVGEGPLEGVDVILKGCGAEVTQTTGTDGTFMFADIPAGSCTLEVFKGGWGFSGSAPDLGYPLPVGSDPSLPTNVGILMAPMSDNLSEPNIGMPQLSSNLVYYGADRCDPGQVTVQVKAQHPDGVKVMVFFHRLHELNGSKDSGWSEGFSMNTGGDDLYTLSTSGARLVGESGFTTQAVVSYQFVMQTQNGEFIRSEVYNDLYLSPCGSPPPPVVTGTPGIIFPPLIIVTPTLPVIH